MAVTEWDWRKHVSRTSGKEMLRVTYYGKLSEKPINEYLCVTHDGFAGQKAHRLLVNMAMRSGAPVAQHATLEDIAEGMQQGTPPAVVRYRPSGKFFNVTERIWPNETESA